MDAGRLVGWNLRRLRVEREMTMETLAGEADVEASYIAKIERAVANPTVAALAKLAKALRITIPDLFRPFPPGSKAPRPLKSGPRPRQVRTKR